MKNPVNDVIDSYADHDYTDEVDRDFRDWLTDPAHAGEKESGLQRLWMRTEADDTPGFDQSLRDMRRATGIYARRRERLLSRRLILWRVAAVVIAAVSLTALFLTTRPLQQPDLLQSYIPTAQTGTITLPDGTLAMVNSRSTLIYPQEFAGKERCVYLIGEANFRVKPDAAHPFGVKAADIQVTALGTEFNIAAYPDEEEIRATLLSGSVAVDYDSLSRRTILEPGHQLAWNKSTRQAGLTRPDLDDVTAWQRGDIVMRSLTPDEIFTRLGRRFPCTFIYNSHNLKDDRYTLTFGNDASLSEVMDIITRVMGNVRYRLEGDRCYIY